MFKIAAGLCVVVALGVGRLSAARYLVPSEEAEAQEESGRQPTRAGVVRPQTHRIENDVAAAGMIVPVRVVDVTVATAGRVTEVHVT